MQHFGRRFRVQRRFGFSQLCQTKVQDFYVIVAPDHDVFRLDVAMHHARRMRRRQRRGHLDCDFEGFGNFHRPRGDALA